MRATLLLLVAVLALSVGVAACGSDDEKTTTEIQTEVQTDVKTQDVPVTPTAPTTPTNTTNTTTGVLAPCPQGEVRSAPGNKCRPQPAE
ncbi:MAG: hypothetical protein EXQ70_08775 [Solirubrobacterales bacterium]|nr:hypothetical protein [Solirubrobacterales bacterium]